ncbi:MAG: hypothetical protein KDE52_14425 [Calditrichaeota bacterium]|nr:hypothetical protein [Calditrichota bacterium]MCB0285465.1 hypothetical protein [Calditrichota bacterium]MCB0301249.1 hypothetical protein [Calditrichota bacterium]MCB9067644.1 hypothetical protein [Calditrichia bacterium]
MPYVSVNFSKMSLKAPENWLFGQVKTEIWARSEARIGVLRIRKIDDAAPDKTVAELEENLRQFINAADLQTVFDVRKPVTSDYVFGGYSYFSSAQHKDLFIRGWYLQRNNCLILGAYACPKSQYQSETAVRECQESQRIMLTVQPES